MSRTLAAGLALLLFVSSAFAQAPRATSAPVFLRVQPNALLTIDQHRSTVIERVVNQWGDALAASNGGIGSAELREMLSGMRSDHLLAASLAGTLNGLRDVMANSLTATAEVKAGRVQPMSMGDL